MATGPGNQPSSWDEARQLGQLLLVGFEGTKATDEIRGLIEDYHVGSVLLTARNLTSAAQATQLILDLQTIAFTAGHPVPLLIAIDQEDFCRASLGRDVLIRQFPGLMALAATGSKALAAEVARATARELAACGVNWIIGPSLPGHTTNQTPNVGATGIEAQDLSDYAAELVKGYQEAGMVTCCECVIQTEALTWTGTPPDPRRKSTEDHYQTALNCFRDAIAQGVDSIMVGGAACLSKEIVNDLLRLNLQFDGLVISDCLEAFTSSQSFDVGNRAVSAVEAGCDLVYFCETWPVQQQAISSLVLAVETKDLLLQTRLRRVSQLKLKCTSWESALKPGGVEGLVLLQVSHESLATTVYEASTTVVRDENHFLPLSRVVAPQDEIVLLTPLNASPADLGSRRMLQSSNPHQHGVSAAPARTEATPKPNEVFQNLGRSLAQRGKGKILHAPYSANGVRPAHERMIAQARSVIVITCNADKHLYQYGFTKHISLICRLEAHTGSESREKPCIVIAVDSPYDFVFDISIGTYICTYDLSEGALQALIKVLWGEIISTGVLPAPMASRERVLVLENLATWQAPAGMARALARADVKFDIVYGPEYSGSILGLLRTTSPAAVVQMYQRALANPSAHGIIRAKGSADEAVLGSIVLSKSISSVGQAVAKVPGREPLIGALSCPVVSRRREDGILLLQGLVFLGVKQLKRQGAVAALLDRMDVHVPPGLFDMGFRMAER